MEHVKNTPQAGEVHLMLTDLSNMYVAVQVFTEAYDAPAANTAGAEHYAAADTSRLYMAQSPPADTTTKHKEQDPSQVMCDVLATFARDTEPVC